MISLFKFKIIKPDVQPRRLHHGNISPAPHPTKQKTSARSSSSSGNSNRSRSNWPHTTRERRRKGKVRGRGKGGGLHEPNDRVFFFFFFFFLSRFVACVARNGDCWYFETYNCSRHEPDNRLVDRMIPFLGL